VRVFIWGMVNFEDIFVGLSLTPVYRRGRGGVKGKASESPIWGAFGNRDELFTDGKNPVPTGGVR
jgi:hypothetical protein